MSLAMIGFAIYIYGGDRATALGIIAFVGGHWLGVGSFATGKTLSDIAVSGSAQLFKETASVVRGNTAEGD